MKIKIFEDQTGFALFPEKSFDKNATIVKFFDNKIDLYVSKGDLEEDLSIINCYVLVYKGQERPIGCYIVGSDKYSDNIFTTFKNDAINALNKIGFKPHHDNVENAIFESLEKFDSNISSKINIDEISEALESNEKLSYNAGDITEIAVFCRQLLKTIEKIRITVSTGQTNLGNINVLRNKTYQERLAPTTETKEIFNRRRNSMRKKKEDENNKKRDEEKRNKGNSGDSNISEGTKLIKDGLSTKRGAGYDTEEDIKRVYTELSGKPLPEKSEGMGTGTIILMSIALLMLGMIIGGFAMQHWYPKEKISENIPNVNNDNPTPNTVSTVNISFTPTETLTAVLNANENNSNSENINNSSVAEKTKELMNTTSVSKTDNGSPLTDVTVTVTSK